LHFRHEALNYALIAGTKNLGGNRLNQSGILKKGTQPQYL
jgi:hypothetical protein